MDDKTTMRSESLDTTLPIVPTDSTTNNNINLFQNDNTVNKNFLQNSSTDTIDDKEIVYIYITPSSAPVQVPIIISVVVAKYYNMYGSDNDCWMYCLSHCT